LRQVDIRIDGIVSTDVDDIYQFINKFIVWVESNGWTFGGGFKEEKEE
jgi:hypothetical protein